MLALIPFIVLEVNSSNRWVSPLLRKMLFLLPGNRNVRSDGADRDSRHIMVLLQAPKNRLIFILNLSDFYSSFFFADNPGRGQRSGEDVSVGAVRSGEIHPRFLLGDSGHRIYGVCVCVFFLAFCCGFLLPFIFNNGGTNIEIVSNIGVSGSFRSQRPSVAATEQITFESLDADALWLNRRKVFYTKCTGRPETVTGNDRPVHPVLFLNFFIYQIYHIRRSQQLLLQDYQIVKLWKTGFKDCFERDAKGDDTVGIQPIYFIFMKATCRDHWLKLVIAQHSPRCISRHLS